MDVRNDVEKRTGVVEAGHRSEGVPGGGSTGFDRVEANGRSMVSEWTVLGLVPRSHARWSLDSGPIMGTDGYICELAAGATRVTLEASVRPTGWYRLLGPVFGMIGRRQNRADVVRLKSILEGEALRPPRCPSHRGC